MTQPVPHPLRRLIPPVVLLALAACAPQEIRDDSPGRAQGFPPVYTQTMIPGGGPAPDGRRTWSRIQADGGRPEPRRAAAQAQAQAQAKPDPAKPDPDAKAPPRHRRGSSSPPPDPGALSPAPRPVPLPQPGSTQGATDAFKRDLIRPEVSRMRQDDALGRLDPMGQRDLMKRENDLRQWGDPLAR